MPQQPSGLPTPLDLARVRPRPAQPPPHSRRQAGLEKDRAGQEQRVAAEQAAEKAGQPIAIDYRIVASPS